ncbi:MAG: DUF58 domain-containing protein [Bacteroidia bacterium]
MKDFIRAFYFSNLLYVLVALNVTVFVFGFIFPLLYEAGVFMLRALAVLVVTDTLILFINKRGIHATRHKLNRMSNGDENMVSLLVENKYLFKVRLEVIDELPVQFQIRDFKRRMWMNSGELSPVNYLLKPVERGEYHFGAINVFVGSFLGLVKRKYRFNEEMMFPVYPSYIQMRKYELLAISNRLVQSGIKKIRRIGNTSEFDQIKEYTSGDDIRTINWKATARKNRFMVNKYQDEKSQNVYSIIDMGRAMKMPFEQMTLLDYAINSSLVISNIAWLKHDKPGLITFSDKVVSYLPAERRGSQMFRIMETLYNQKTGFSESGYEQLYTHIKTRITQRSLLLLFSNFETLNGLRRQLKYLRRIAKHHLLVVVFFENTELKAFLNKPVQNTLDIYYKTIAEKFEQEKRLITKELHAYGIQSIYTAPQNLSVNTINKYLELKSRGLI